MKEKVIVFGLGQDFESCKEVIREKYHVVACSDNLATPAGSFWKECFVIPGRLTEIEFDKVLICSEVHYNVIKSQLINLGISSEKIFGLDILGIDQKQRALEELYHDIELYKKRNTDKKFELSEKMLYLIEKDKQGNAGVPSKHYFAQDLWMAQKIFQNNPQNHYDIGSRLDGFIAHLLVFREVNYIDIRPLPYKIPGLHFVQGDATNLVTFEDEAVESLSCLHALEHFGLGRYGDEIDPDAYKKGAESMKRILEKGGHLYIGVPIGPVDKLRFNAHRIFSIHTILSLFDGMQLKDIAIVEPDGVVAEGIEEKDYLRIQDYSCGLFEFIK